MSGVPDLPRRRAHACVLSAGSDAVISHTTAAALHGLPGFELDGDRVHVTTRTEVAHAIDGSILHTSRALPEAHCTVRDGIRVTTVARTLFDLGRLCGDQRVERALDSALAMKLVTVAQLEQVFCDLAGPGRAGTRIMRKLLAERSDGYVAPASRLERRFLDIVRRYDLPQPRREINLGDNGEWLGRVEFVYDHGVHVEIDGRRWHTALLDMESDRQRDNAFAAAGFITLRFTARMLERRPGVVAQRVRDALATAAARAAPLAS
jgi:hypothetical protein